MNAFSLSLNRFIRSFQTIALFVAIIASVTDGLQQERSGSASFPSRRLNSTGVGSCGKYEGCEECLGDEVLMCKWDTEANVCEIWNNTSNKERASSCPAGEDLKCTEAQTCSACLEKSPETGDKVCIWEEEKCEEKSGPRQSANACDAPTDPCSVATECTACKEQDAGENGMKCVFDADDGTCTKREEASAPADMCLTPDPCGGATDCGACDTVDVGEDGKACIFDAGKCTIGQEAEKPASMCPDDSMPAEQEQPVSAPAPTPSKEAQSSSSSSGSVVVVLLVVCGVAYYGYKKTRGKQSFQPGNAPPRRFHDAATYEGVSTSDAIDEGDDWDWEDGGGDIELANDTKKTDSDSFQTAQTSGFAPFRDTTAPQAPKTPPSQKKRLIRRTGSKDKKGLVPPIAPVGPTKPKPGMVNQPISTAQTQPSVQQDMPSYLSQSNVPAMITKLGSPKSKSKAPAATEKPKTTDDFFAEFDLTAKPSFSQKPTPATLPAIKPATAALPTPAPMKLVADETDFGDDDWGDDGDLDDLLDD